MNGYSDTGAVARELAENQQAFHGEAFDEMELAGFAMRAQRLTGLVEADRVFQRVRNSTFGRGAEAELGGDAHFLRRGALGSAAAEADAET